jgi:hypothetical protein
MKSQRNGYQPSTLKNPVNSWSRLLDTSRASETRSIVRLIDGNGGQRKKLG